MTKNQRHVRKEVLTGRLTSKTLSGTTPRRARKISSKLAPKAEPQEETGLDDLVPSTTEARDATNFRRIIAARKSLEDAEQELRDAVAAAREAGDSWAIIGVALDTTRQAAYQRFGKVTADR